MPNIGELFIEIGLDGANNAASEVDSLVGLMSELNLKSVAAVGALTATGYALWDISKGAAASAESFRIFQDTTGIAWQRLQDWQIVGESVGVGAAKTQSAIESLQSKIVGFRWGEGDKSAFAMLGIDYSKGRNAIDVLEELQQKIQGLDRGAVSNLLSKMTIPRELIEVLQLSKAQFDQRRSIIPGITDKEFADFNKLSLLLHEMDLHAKQFGYDLAEAVGPTISRGVKELIKDLEHLHDILNGSGTAKGLDYSPEGLSGLFVGTGNVDIPDSALASLAQEHYLGRLSDAQYKRGLDNLNGAGARPVVINQQNNVRANLTQKQFEESMSTINSRTIGQAAQAISGPQN